MTAPTFVCRECGSDNLGTVEAVSEWRYATVEGDDARHPEVTEYGDTVGEQTSTTVGYVCLDCDTERRSLRRLTMTRRGYERTHPLRPWYVNVERIAGTQAEHTDAREHKRVRVMARDAREAASVATQNGMQPGDRFPWRPAYYLGQASTNRKETAA